MLCRIVCIRFFRPHLVSLENREMAVCGECELSKTFVMHRDALRIALSQGVVNLITWSSFQKGHKTWQRVLAWYLLSSQFYSIPFIDGRRSFVAIRSLSVMVSLLIILILPILYSSNVLPAEQEVRRLARSSTCLDQVEEHHTEVVQPPRARAATRTLVATGPVNCLVNWIDCFESTNWHSSNWEQHKRRKRPHGTKWNASNRNWNKWRRT